MGFLALNRRRGIWQDTAKKKKITRNPFSTKLRFEPLEDRRLLATFLETGSTLMLALATNEQVGIVSHGDSYTFSLGDTGMWAGADSARATSQNGAPALLVSPAGLAAFSGISIIDSGSGASVRFEDSGANAYSNSFSVVLDKGGAESAVVSGAADFGNFRVDLTARQIIVDGRLTAKEVRLLGSETVTVTGAVQAPALKLTAGLLDNSGELSSSGAVGGRLSIAAERFVNSGRITADGSAGGIISIALAQRMMQTQSGLVSASGVGGSGGQITIVAGDTTAATASADSAPVTGVYLSGMVAANGSGADATGGEITVTGRQLDLYGTRLQADGEEGGGQIRVGGDFHGLGDLQRAHCVTVNHASTLSADALARGNGGQIVVWSDQQTSFAGLARARGGAQQGDGGKIEVSGRSALEWQGEANVSAAAGRPGSLWLDPKNITVAGPTFSEFVDPNPAAGNQFGYDVVALSTGNVVITSPYDDFGAMDTGAVYLFNGATGALISTLHGSTANDRVGFGGVIVLTNGNYVVSSSNWNNGAATSAGAVTWGSGTSGVSGVVSSANSLVGSTANDRVGSVTALTNGNYVVSSPNWNNGAATSAGAVTWGSGTSGVSGVVSSANSLVGSTANDQVGSVTALTNGNYVVSSPNWNNGAATSAGAVTWGNGMAGVSGVVSSANSLVGSTANDRVGYLGGNGVTVLNNGNYLVSSLYWDNGAATDAGAVTWGSGTSGVSGVVSSANSLVYSTNNDVMDNWFWGVTALTNGNYVVHSPLWNNGAVTSAGAVTWGNGTTGISGVVSSANSLVGSTAHDQVGSVTALTNGNYVIVSTNWDNGAVIDAGAVTWGSGTAGVSGVVSSANSLVVSTTNDNMGLLYNSVIALTNGNYVVSSPSWDNGAATDAGAVTWGSGTAGVKGVVSSANSLVGLTSNSGLTSVVVDNVNDTFYASFYTESGTTPGGGTYGGRVRVGSQSAPPLASQTFASQTGQSVILTPNVTGTLDTGAAVTLQASNDITITSAITANNPGGNGGDLTLQAGRSLLINANITTDNGNLTLTANDTVANGVVDADRDSGSAVITQAGGTTLNVGSGTLTVNLRNSTDKTYNARGVATFQNLSAGSIVLGDGTLIANSISTGTLTIGAGAKVIIKPRSGGKLGSLPLQNKLSNSLAAGAISPIDREITNQATVTSTVEQSPSTATAVESGPLAASTVLAAHRSLLGIRQAVAHADADASGAIASSTDLAEHCSLLGVGQAVAHADADASGAIASSTVFGSLLGIGQAVAHADADASGAITSSTDLAEHCSLLGVGQAVAHVGEKSGLESGEAGTMAATSSRLIDTAIEFREIDVALNVENLVKHREQAPGLNNEHDIYYLTPNNNRLTSQLPIYVWIDSTALPKIIDNWLEKPFMNKAANTVFASWNDEAAKRDSLIFVDTKIGTVPDFAALQTNGFTRSVKSTIVEKNGFEVDFDITRVARVGNYARQLEKVIDTVIAEDDDLFRLVQ